MILPAGSSGSARSTTLLTMDVACPTHEHKSVLQLQPHRKFKSPWHTWYLWVKHFLNTLHTQHSGVISSTLWALHCILHFKHAAHNHVLHSDRALVWLSRAIERVEGKKSEQGFNSSQTCQYLNISNIMCCLFDHNKFTRWWSLSAWGKCQTDCLILLKPTCLHDAQPTKWLLILLKPTCLHDAQPTKWLLILLKPSCHPIMFASFWTMPRQF